MSALPITTEKTSRRTNSATASSPASAHSTAAIFAQLRNLYLWFGYCPKTCAKSSMWTSSPPARRSKHRTARAFVSGARFIGEPCDVRRPDEAVLRHGDTRAAREFQHDEFVFGNGREAGGRQLD